MKARTMTIVGITALIIIAIIALILFRKQKDDELITNRLTWFELQISPFEYRFAIIPQQPILISGIGPENATLLLRHESDPDGYNRTVESVAAILMDLKIITMPMQNPEKSFSDEFIETESVHVRFRFADDTSWVSYYNANEVPATIKQLISRTRSIGEPFLSRETNRTLSADEAVQALKAENNPFDLRDNAIVLKLHIAADGRIEVNRRTVSIHELQRILDLLAEKKGTVWYSRNDPEKDPDGTVEKTMKAVLHEAAKRSLPIQLNRERY
jgi:hypothetical protein